MSADRTSWKALIWIAVAVVALLVLGYACGWDLPEVTHG